MNIEKENRFLKRFADRLQFAGLITAAAFLVTSGVGRGWDIAMIATCVGFIIEPGMHRVHRIVFGVLILFYAAVLFSFQPFSLLG